MKPLLFAVALTLAALPATASEEITRVKAATDVPTTMDALVEAVTGAGAAVVARVNHAAAADSVGLELAPSQLLIFGNPKLGTPAMQDDPLAGLFLPLKVLVYQDADGQVWLAYEKPSETLDDLNIADDAEYLKTMAGALAKLTGVAAGN